MTKRIWLIFFTAVIAIISFNINNIYAAVIDEVRFEGNKRIPDTRITPYLIKAGNEFDIKEFNESIKKLYGTGLFLNRFRCSLFNNRWSFRYGAVIP